MADEILNDDDGGDAFPLVRRLPLRFVADRRWVVTRPFFPGGESRIRHVVDRIEALSPAAVDRLLGQIRGDFYSRHKQLDAVLAEHYETARQLVPDAARLDPKQRLIAGAYFTMEYAFASAALFNPSIVAHPDQRGMPPDTLRFIISFRATGEGHVSSIVFRTGQLGPDQAVTFDPPPVHSDRLRVSPDRHYDKPLFRRKLADLVSDQAAVALVMDRLPDRFSYKELEDAIEASHQTASEDFRLTETTDSIQWLARENYRLSLPDEAELSEIVVFPQSDNELMGIEDLRLVRFVEDDGTVTFYGTYSAFDGTHVLPQLMATTDFHHLQMHTLNGSCVKNKGLALFPRRIGGHYCMCSRIDGENLFIMYSDIIEFWESAELLQAPKHPWEFMQIGNCGSPIETSEGWLLLTHGVGPIRSYCIGAMLLDLDDPLKVIGHLEEPLIMPTPEEREGYVPNVVYTCGALPHHDHLFIPYAMSDLATGFAVVPMERLLNRLLD